jgi:hypothetical protein
MNSILAKLLRVVDRLPRGLLPTAVFIALCLLHAARIPGRFLHCAPFSEEASVFLSANVQGRIEWFTAGYFNLFSSLVIWLSSLVSIYWTPWITTLVAVPVTVASFAYLLLPHWEPLLPFRYRASLVAFFLLFSPIHEGIGICLYSFWYFSVGSIWLLIEATYLPEEFKKHRLWKLLYVLLGSVSGAAVMQVTLSYLAAFVAIGGGGRWPASKQIAPPTMASAKLESLGKLRTLIRDPLLWTLLLGMLVQAIAMHMTAPGDNSSSPVRWWRFPEASLFQINMRVFAPSVVGVHAAYWVNNSEILSCLMLGGLLGVCTFILRQGRASWRGEVAMVLLLAAVFSTWVLYLGRPSMFRGFRSRPWRVEMHAIRYSLIPLVFFASSLAVALDCWNPLPKVKRQVLRIALPWLLLAGMLNFPGTQPAPDCDWAETAAQLEEFRAGRRDEIERRVHPGLRLSIVRPPSHR